MYSQNPPTAPALQTMPSTLDMVVEGNPMAHCGNNDISGRVELSISIKDIPNMDVMSKSDPMVVVYLKSGFQNGIVEIGRTECIKDTLTCSFSESIVTDFYFEAEQNLLFYVYDVDDFKHQANLKKQDLVGIAGPIGLAQIMMAELSTQTLPIRCKGACKKTCSLTVVAEQLAECFMSASFYVSCKGLPKRDLFSSDPFFVISKSSESTVGGGWVNCYTSDVVKKTVKPKFKMAEISLLKLCNGDMSRPLKITFYDWERSGKHDYMCEVVTSAAELSQSYGTETTLTLKNPTKKSADKRNKARGTMTVHNWTVKDAPTFASLLHKGLKMHLSVAVDFTASNGNVSQPGTLHYIDPHTGTNQYIAAIRSLAAVLAPYDPEGRFTALGFGAVLPTGQTSHCFCMAPGDGSVFGPQGIEAAYRTTLANVRLSGPTIFSQLIHQVSQRAIARGPGHYDVMLLLTDGIVTDVQHTIKAVIESSNTPLSIIICGVGQRDWEAMNVLDADDVVLTQNGVDARRDIVQFVPFLDFCPNPAALAVETLAELPGQVEEWAAIVTDGGGRFI